MAHLSNTLLLYLQPAKNFSEFDGKDYEDQVFDGINTSWLDIKKNLIKELGSFKYSS